MTVIIFSPKKSVMITLNTKVTAKLFQGLIILTFLSFSNAASGQSDTWEPPEEYDFFIRSNIDFDLEVISIKRRNYECSDALELASYLWTGTDNVLDLQNPELLAYILRD